MTKIVHSAVSKAKRHPGRIVYVIRDRVGKLHFTLFISYKGKILLMASVSSVGDISLVRHV